MELTDAIAQELARWETPVVEPRVFGTVDPPSIAARISALCKARLGADVAGCSFYRVSVGCVAGLQLDDGRHVVVKVHQPQQSPARLKACHGVQTLLAARAFPCPTPLLAPAPLAPDLAAHASAESFLHVGSRVDGHTPDGRRLIATALHQLVEAALPAAGRDDLCGAWFTSLGTRLWPRPHNDLFDFEATTSGAEWIDALARRARQVPAAGPPVVAHFDWRAEHLLFDDGQLSTAHDWDSVHLEREAVAVGAAAHAFTAQYDRGDVAPAPTREGIEAFIADYERARGLPFNRAEQATVRAACVYGLAYTARCEHALGASASGHPFGETLREAGASLLQAP